MAKTASAKAGHSLPSGPLSQIAVTEERTGTVGSSEGTSAGGSNYVPLKTERRTMTYILAKSDFKIIAYTNTLSLAAFSMAALSFSVWLSFYTGWFFTPTLSPDLVLATKAVLWLTGGFTIILLILGVWNLIRRQSHIKQIEDETKEV